MQHDIIDVASSPTTSIISLRHLRHFIDDIDDWWNTSIIDFSLIIW